MQQLLQSVRCIAATDNPVLLRGETGTGKEFIARLIHSTSTRAGSVFVKLDCETSTKKEVERLLFQHSVARGEPGLIELSRGGTLFIGGVEHLSSRCQLGLLQAILKRKHNANGVYGPDAFRLIATTQNRLETLVASGKFRADLYYQIQVFAIHLPPLRERPEDVGLIAERFLRQFNQATGRHITLGKNVHAMLKKCRWPGNIHELKGCVLQAAANISAPVIDRMPCGNGDCLARVPLPTGVPVAKSQLPSSSDRTMDNLVMELSDESQHDVNESKLMQPMVSRDTLTAAMQASGWVQAQAARRLHLTSRQIGYALRKYGIKVQRP